MMENLQMASPDGNGDDDDDMMSQLDELGDMIRQQQDLRDRTFKQGQEQRRQNNASAASSRRAGKASRGKVTAAAGPGHGPAAAGPAGAARPPQQIARRLEEPRLRPEPARPGAGQGQGPDESDQLGRAGQAMGEAEGDLGKADPDSAVDAQGRALDALRKGAQSLAQSMQQQMGQGQGPGRVGRFGQPRAEQDTDPLGRPLRGHEYSDDATVKVPGEIDVQRARRIIEELRKRFGEMGRSQEELDYIERLLKDY